MEARAEHSAKRIVMLSIVTSSSHRLHCYYRILTIKRMRAGRRDFLLSRHLIMGILMDMEKQVAGGMTLIGKFWCDYPICPSNLR